MEKYQGIIDWFKHNSPWLIPIVLGILANLYNGMAEYPKARSIIGWVIDIFSIVTRKDSTGTFKMPFRTSKVPVGKQHMRTGKPVITVQTLLPFLIASSILSTSCMCWKPEGKNDPKCIVVRQIVDCTTDAIKNLGPVVAGIIGGLINGNTNVDWDSVLTRLEGAGIKDAGCILAQLENDFMSKPAASPEYAARAKTVHETFSSWKSKHNMAGVQFKLKSNGKDVLR